MAFQPSRLMRLIMALICAPGPNSYSLSLPMPNRPVNVSSHRTGSTSCRVSIAAIPLANLKGSAVTLEITGMRGSLKVTVLSTCQQTRIMIYMLCQVSN